MSMILDALRKSDRQRVRHASERLREGPGVATTRNSLPRPALWIGLGLLSAVIVIVLLVYTRLPLESTLPRPVATGADPEIMENGPARATIRALSDELAVRAPVIEDKATPEPSLRSGSAVSVEDLNAMPFESLPADMRAALPPLHVNVHAWSEDVSARFVLINLRRYREGDRLEEGPRVRRILPDGVVLESDGMRFSLPRQ